MAKPKPLRQQWGDGAPPDLDQIMRDMRRRLMGWMRGDGPPPGALLPVLLVVLVALVLAFQSFYVLDEKERAVVLRLGKFHGVAGPGLSFYPWPIDQLFVAQVTEERQYSSRGLMLTRDENIVNVPLTVQYNIKSIKDFVLNVQDPGKSLEHATDSAIRHVVGSTSLDDVLGEGRAALADEVRSRLQAYLDNYGAGINIVDVTIQRAEPPRQVKSAFDDVVAAKEDQERFQNEAEGYRNEKLPEARGRAQRLIEEAEGHKGRVVERARGEALRFEKLLAEYIKAEEVTRQRLYIEAVQEVLSNSQKVLIDVEGGNNLMYLPLDKLATASVPAGAGAGVAPAAPADLAEVRRQLEELQRLWQESRQGNRLTDRRNPR